jgi:hypothetical protein
VADLTTTIETEAALPASSSADGQSASARPIGDLIKAQQFIDAKAVLKKRRRGLLFTKLVTPGAASDCGRASNQFNTNPDC